MKFSIKITLKKDVLDPQGKVVQQTLHNMGMNTLNEDDETTGRDKIEDMCKKLLVNMIIEDFEISKI